MKKNRAAGGPTALRASKEAPSRSAVVSNFAVNGEVRNRVNHCMRPVLPLAWFRVALDMPASRGHPTTDYVVLGDD